MAKKILDIYTEYKIILNLQEHMLRVAAVASLICDSFTEPLPKEEIVTACLLHDMGNVIKFDMKLFPKFFEPEGVEYWQSVKDEYVKKYGKNEHKATMTIAQELKVDSKVYDIMNLIGFTRAVSNAEAKFFMGKIGCYSDMRVTPSGLTSLKDRLDDLEVRYADKSVLGFDQVKEIHKSLYEIEKQIFSKCKIKPEDITNEAVAPIIEELRGFVV